jgi:molecular chaperone GrpE
VPDQPNEPVDDAGDDAADGAVDPDDASVPDDLDAEIAAVLDEASEAAGVERDAFDEKLGRLDHASEAAEEVFVDGTVGRSDLAAERDEYLDALRRVKAEFDNFRKRTDKEREADIDKRVGAVVADLLPVLDACDAAIAHGDEGVAQIRNLLFDLLSKSGLEIDDPAGKPFDPNIHDAVLQEPGDGETDTVIEVLRSGYSWRGRVIRPAMVKVRT